MITHAPSRDPATVGHILCPIDFSDFSRRAVEAAVPLARAFQADITALFVFPLEADGKAMVPDEGARSAVAADLAPFLEPARAAGIHVEVQQRAGNPVTEILDEARRIGAGLIAMGTHGRSGVRRLVLGSVADEVLRRAPCSVLTVSHPDAGPESVHGRILCAVDVTPNSERTLEAASALGRALQAPVTLLHVVEPGGSDEAFWARRSESLERLHDAAARAGAWPSEKEETVTAGTAHAEILSAAAERRASLIVVGTHAPDDVERGFCGSTADRVAREAGCPVVTVRGAGDHALGTLSRSGHALSSVAR